VGILALQLGEDVKWSPDTLLPLLAEFVEKRVDV
jgi:hypothetical protein